LTFATGIEDMQPSAQERLLLRYERFIEISQQLNSTLDHYVLLRKIVDAATELTQSEAASILLVDEATGELHFELASNMPSSQLETITVPLEGSIAGWVVMNDAPRIIQDVRNEPDFFKNVDDATSFKTHNILAVPMRAYKKNVIGVLETLNKRNNEDFSVEDVKTLTMLAVQAAIAIENARLFRQSDFMSMMVHELRTPLSAIKTSTKLLLRTNLSESQRTSTIHTMNDEIDRLIRMTSDYLDLARLESGRARLELSSFDLSDLIKECITIVAPYATERSIEIAVFAQTTTINADRNKVKQVLLNLLTNAIKYNRDKGEIMVECSRIEHSEDAQVIVRDTGHGISKEDQRMMFQKFFRVSDTEKSATGTGLGLAITRQIIQAHNGEIWLESEIGQGSSFFFTLPK
jgi:K+-sensing histidine kinase KdpD